MAHSGTVPAPLSLLQTSSEKAIAPKIPLFSGLAVQSLALRLHRFSAEVIHASECFFFRR